MIQKELNKDQIKACSVPENQNSLKMSIVSQRGKKRERERCLHWKTNPYQYFTNQLISLRHSMPFTLGIANCVQTKQRSKMYCLTQWQIVSAGSAVWKSLRSVAVRTIYNHLWWEKLTGILNSLRLIWHFHTIKSNNSFFSPLMDTWGPASACCRFSPGPLWICLCPGGRHHSLRFL